MPVAPQPAEVFFSYSHVDEKLRDKLAIHLVMLEREGTIRGWHDRGIIPGQEWDGEIDERLKSADIILLLVSPDFLASKYCYDIEVKQAMERHEAGEACVIPIILRPCDWTRAPFSGLQALPKNTTPITRWPDEDEAFLNVAEGIRRAAEELLSPRPQRVEPADDSAKASLPFTHVPHPPIVGFVARRDEQGRDIVGRLKEELAMGRSRLVILAGPGGVGKTTLAAEAARSLAYEFGGRVVWSGAGGRVTHSPHCSTTSPRS